MTQYEICQYAEIFLRLHKVSNPFSWHSLSRQRDLQTQNFDNEKDGKVLREELLNRGLIIKTYTGSP